MPSGGVPDEVPAHWLVYFAVEDTDATVEQGQGARRQRRLRADRHPDVGRFAIVTDPYGAVFAVIKPQPPAES